MKYAQATVIAFLTAAVLASASYGQGRHDEKPHGTKKAPATTEQQVRGGGTGGRHDEGITTHGRKKQALRQNGNPFQEDRRKQ
jgi:hypothetical protein